MEARRCMRDSAAAMKVPSLQETITDTSGLVLQIYAYRWLTRAEYGRRLRF
jgi:hypothetical protein